MNALAAMEFAGLRAEDEHCLLTPHPEPHFSESYLVKGADNSGQLGYWLHLSATPGPFDPWRERLILIVPGRGQFVAYNEGRVRSCTAPAASCLSYEIIEPFRTWRIKFDATLHQVSSDTMQLGLVPYSARVSVEIDLVLEAVAPPWRPVLNDSAGTDEQQARGVTFHYEQLYRATGTIRIGDDEPLSIDGTGMRDHSRGPRHFGRFGSNLLCGVSTLNNDGFGLIRVKDRDDSVILQSAYIARNGTIEPAEVLEASPITSLSNKHVDIRLQAHSGRVLHAQGKIKEAAWITMTVPNGGIFGIDWTDPENRVLQQSLVEWTWDQGSAWGMLERSVAVSVLGKVG